MEFAREVLDFEPWAKQREVCASVLENKRTAVRGAHGVGKDAVLAALLLWACYAREMLCVTVSATARQVIGQTWAELARMWTRAGLGGELFVGRAADRGRAGNRGHDGGEHRQPHGLAQPPWEWSLRGHLGVAGGADWRGGL